MMPKCLKLKPSWNLSMGFINSASLKCVVELDIADAIHNYGKPMPHSNLISSLKIHPSKTQSLYRLMRLMILSGLFSQHNVTENEQEVEYALTDASRLLVKNQPMSVASVLGLDGIFTKTWDQVSNWFKSDDDGSSFEMAYGVPIWEYAARDPIFNKAFNDSMASDTQFVTTFVIEKYKEVFMGLESLVDVGGGTGIITKAIAKSFPHMKCVVLDLPHVVAGLQGSDNLKYVQGNMFEAIPPTDAILLKWILHDWNDEKCTKILKKCKEAITREDKKGKVIIIDMVINDNEKKDDATLETQLFSDIRMMVVCNGKERTKEEWVKLISFAGFSGYKITPVLG